MISEPVLVDTGPLVAILHDGDRHHQRCWAQATDFRGPVLSCWSVVTETAWLVRHLPNGLGRLLDMIAVGELSMLGLDAHSAKSINALRETYNDLRPQLADLCLVHLAHREGITRIFTVDRRDFFVYRDKTGMPFTLLPEVA